MRARLDCSMIRVGVVLAGRGIASVEVLGRGERGWLHKREYRSCPEGAREGTIPSFSFLISKALRRRRCECCEETPIGVLVFGTQHRLRL